MSCYTDSAVLDDCVMHLFFSMEGNSLFQHIDASIDVVKAISYINADWDAQPMWDGWGDT